MKSYWQMTKDALLLIVLAIVVLATVGLGLMYVMACMMGMPDCVI
jgi:hypothetical protein